MVADTCVEQWLNPILNTFDYRQHIFYFLAPRVPKGIKLQVKFTSLTPPVPKLPRCLH